MYLKVAQITLLSLLITACSNPFSPSPKKQDNTQNLGVEVVEEVEATPAKKTTPARVAPALSSTKKVKTTTKQVKKKVSKKISKVKKKKEDKYSLKPEPFSIESNQDDPELLGPQTTLDTPLSKKENNNSQSI